MTHTKAIVLAMLLTLPQVAAAQHRYVSYTDLTTDFNPSVLTIEPSANRVLVGHASRSAEFCTQSSFRCVESGSFSFAVPSEGLGVGSEWKFRRDEYQVTAEVFFEVLGVRCSCFLIRRKKDGSLFYYSRERGLLAFALRSSEHEGRDVFISVAANGYLADSK